MWLTHLIIARNPLLPKNFHQNASLNFNTKTLTNKQYFLHATWSQPWAFRNWHIINVPCKNWQNVTHTPSVTHRDIPLYLSSSHNPSSKISLSHTRLRQSVEKTCPCYSTCSHSNTPKSEFSHSNNIFRHFGILALLTLKL